MTVIPRRASVRGCDDFEAFPQHLMPAEVFVDGKECEGVFAYDMDQGMAWVYSRDDEGEYIIENDELASHAVNGAVVVVPKSGRS